MAFKKAAVRFGVAESDYLLLGSMGIATFEQLAYRITKADDLEGFLRDSVLPRAAFLEDDGEVIVFRRSPAEPWDEFRLSEDAAAVRSPQGGKVRDRRPRSLSGQAEGEGGPQLGGGDGERPSLFTLTKVSKVLVPPGGVLRAPVLGELHQRGGRGHPCTFREVAERQARDHGQR